LYHRRVRISNRRGFTLVELLVAVVLVNVGLLALVGGSAAVVRRHTIIRARSVAAQMAKARVELLAAVACGAGSGATSGAASGASTTVNGFAETWTVSALANGVRELSERVTFPTPATPGGEGNRNGEVLLRTRVAC
jgi:prepilin-type N-terminal cleavage/methylation domain-containing protein